MTDYNPGDRVRYSAEFRVDGTLTDPTDVAFRWRAGDGPITEETYNPGNIVRDGAGLFHVDVTLTDVGAIYYRWEGSGAVTGAEEGALLSRSAFE